MRQPRRSPIRTLEVKLLDFLASGPPVARILVACSGGVDSLTLLDALARVRRPLHVVTIDHGLRSASAAECERVLAFARAHQLDAERIELHLGKATPAAARAARYAALIDAAARSACDAVAVAHHADDQLETLLDRLLRGSGLKGLAAMRPRRELAPGIALLRPLLAVTRAEIRAYAAAAELDFVEDPSNQDRRYRRTRLRDALASEHPDLARAAVALTHRLAEDEAALQWASAAIDPTDRLQLLQVPRAIRRRAIERLTGPLEANQHQQLDRLLTSEVGTSRLSLSHARTLVRTYDTLSLEQAALRNPQPASRDPQPAIRDPHDAHWRPWQPGDRIKLRGHTRLLSDLFINAKLPRAARAHVRVRVDPSAPTSQTILAIAIPDADRPSSLPPLIERDRD